VSAVKFPALKFAESRNAVLLAVLLSFLLVTLLRVLSSELRIFSYFQNYVYAAALFGFGVGNLHADLQRMKQGMHQWFLYFCVTIILLVGAHFSFLSNIGVLKEGSTFFYYPLFIKDMLLHEVTATSIVFTVFWLTLLIFRSLGFEFGRAVEGIPPLTALFRLVGGFALGWLLSGVIIGCGAPPVVLVAAVIGIVYLLRGLNLQSIVLAALALVSALSFSVSVRPPALQRLIGSNIAALHNFWRPYYHVETMPLSNHGKVFAYAICGNHNPLQFMFDLDMSSMDAELLSSSGEALTGYARDYYDLIYKVTSRPERVLILGAGGGNEVAAALKHGASSIDAVDADAWLFEIGNSHPQKPYASPKVRRIVADPRQFLRNSREKYDLIVYANLESQTAFGPFGVLRNDNFVYTNDSLVDAKLHLKPRGFVALSFVPIRGWFSMRMAHNLYIANDEKIDAELRGVYRNILFAGTDQNELLSGKLIGTLGPALVADVSTLETNCVQVFPSYDDWPFNFAQVQSIPRTYLYCITLLMLSMMICLRSLRSQDIAEEGTLVTRQNLKIAFLGAALILLQNKAAMTFAYNFGSTWDVAVNSALAVSLVTLIATVLCSQNFRVPGWIFWPIAMVLILGEALLINYQAVNYIDNFALRFLASAVVPLIPTFLLACAVTRNIKNLSNSAVAIGMVLCGAGVGAVLESLDFLYGVAFLDFVAVFICVLALLLSLGDRWATRASNPTIAAAGES
jgi:hypothetical protein